MPQMSLPFGFFVPAILVVLGVGILGFTQDAADPVGGDLGAQKRARLKDNAADFWIYDDVAKGFAEAKSSGKPLLVSFRCVP